MIEGFWRLFSPVRTGWILLLTLVPLDRAEAAATKDESKKIRLEAGESYEIKTAKEASLRLSQKKVLEIESLGPGHFRLLALRSGVVAVKAQGADGGILKTWLVTVRPRSAQAEREGVELRDWQRSFCGEAGVRCDAAQRRVYGASDSLPWLHSARRRCEKIPPCRFEVELSAAGRKLWQQRLEAEWEATSFELAADGFVLLREDCPSGTEASGGGAKESTRVGELRRELSERYGAPLLLRCRSLEAQSFVLDILAVAQRRETAERDNPLDWENLRIPLELPLRALVRGLSESGEAHVIAQPEVQLSAGSEVLIADGLEIQTVTVHDGQPATSWKSVGFELRCALLVQRKEKAQLKVELALSRPRGERLDSSRLETTAWLPLEQWQLLGRIQAKTQGEATSSLPWLASIPFIGPLFRWKLEQDAASEVSLFARLRTFSEETAQPAS